MSPSINPDGWIRLRFIAVKLQPVQGQIYDACSESEVRDQSYYEIGISGFLSSFLIHCQYTLTVIECRMIVKRGVKNRMYTFLLPFLSVQAQICCSD